MALEELTKAHPELHAALTFALRAVAEERPADPIRRMAEKLREYHDDTVVKAGESDGAAAGGSGAAAGGAGASAADDADDAARLAAARARGKGRRNVVFAEPVKLDKSFKPTVIPKTPEQRAEIEAVIAPSILFQGMDEDARSIIIDAMDCKRFKAGEVIIKQGDPGDYYYAVSEGKCDIFVNGAKVLETGKGKGFGELALLYDAPRAATVVATTDVATWAVDRVTFKQVMIGTTIKKREMYEAFLKGVPIFNTLTNEEVLTIADALVPAHVKAGEVVVREGDAAADRFYIVEDGELKAEIEGVAGEVCDRLKAGSYFGERALIKDEPRAATVTAVTDSKLLAMDRAAFLRLLGPITELLARNLEIYAAYTATARKTAGSDTERAAEAASAAVAAVTGEGSA